MMNTCSLIAHVCWLITDWYDTSAIDLFWVLVDYDMDYEGVAFDHEGMLFHYERVLIDARNMLFDYAGLSYD